MTPQPRQAAPRFGILGGMLRLGLFRAEGMAGFPDSVQGFLNSFAPMLALILVGALLVATGGDPVFALESAASSLVALLAQPVVSHFLAARWGREAAWLRYATAANWCQWTPILVIAVLLPLAEMATQMGMAPQLAAGLVLLLTLVYALGLAWFLARVGLSLSRGRAALLVAIVHIVLGAVIEIPVLLGHG